MRFIVPVLFALQLVDIGIHPCFATGRWTGHGGPQQSICPRPPYRKTLICRPNGRTPTLWCPDFSCFRVGVSPHDKFRPWLVAAQNWPPQTLIRASSADCQYNDERVSKLAEQAVWRNRESQFKRGVGVKGK